MCIRDRYTGTSAAIIGVSGSGKTTLLQCLAGLDLFDSGNNNLCGIILNKSSIKNIDELLNKNVGFIYQKSHLLPDFSVIENIAMPLLISGVSRAEAIEKALKILDSIQLKNKKHLLPHQLSGGMQQKVAIARACIHKPKIIFADEPTGNLDNKSRDEITELLLNLNKEHNISLCVVTHDNNVAIKLDNIYRIENKTIIKT